MDFFPSFLSSFHKHLFSVHFVADSFHSFFIEQMFLMRPHAPELPEALGAVISRHSPCT